MLIASTPDTHAWDTVSLLEKLPSCGLLTNRRPLHALHVMLSTLPSVNLAMKPFGYNFSSINLASFNLVPPFSHATTTVSSPLLLTLPIIHVANTLMSASTISTNAPRRISLRLNPPALTISQSIHESSLLLCFWMILDLPWIALNRVGLCARRLCTSLSHLLPFLSLSPSGKLENTFLYFFILFHTFWVKSTTSRRK